MSDYEIITDASADMATGAREKYGIKVIPMLYLQNGEEKIADGTESEEDRAAFYEAERPRRGVMNGGSSTRRGGTAGRGGEKHANQSRHVRGKIRAVP